MAKVGKVMHIMEKEFTAVIEGKNSWGKNEIIRVFESAMNRTLIKLYDERIKADED
jgi:hypothetical protein